MWREPGRVDVVDHRRQRRRLARAGRPGEQDDPARLLGERADHLGQAEVVDRPHLEGDRAAGDRDVAALAEGVDAEAREPANLVGEVGLALVRELVEQTLVGQDVLERRARCPPRSAARRPSIGRSVAVDARHRRRVHLDVEVGALPLDHVAQRSIDVERHHLALSGAARRLLELGGRRGLGASSRPSPCARCARQGSRCGRALAISPSVRSGSRAISNSTTACGAQLRASLDADLAGLLERDSRSPARAGRPGSSGCRRVSRTQFGGAVPSLQAVRPGAGHLASRAGPLRRARLRCGCGADDDLRSSDLRRFLSGESQAARKQERRAPHASDR